MAGLSILNPNPKKIPGPQLLHDLVQCDGSQDAVAIEYTSEEGETSTLSYEELHMQADALARRITTSLNKSATQSKRLIVPILIPQCSELYISQLAILKAGGAFCPIVLDTPEERLRFIVADVEASLLLTTSTLQAKLPDLEGLDIIAVDDGNDSQSSTQTARPVSPHDPAYIMYTSGSTGQPKGVCLSHSAATQALLAHDRHIPSFSRFLQFASPTFDVSVFEIFFPLFRGRTLVCCDRRRLLNDLPAAINEMAVDACELTPSVAGSLLRRRESVPSLKVLLTIGEMLKPSVVEEFGGDSNQPAILHGMYGPTEATIHCTLQTNFSKETPCGIIGVPLDTVSAFVIRAQDSDSAETSNLEILPLGEEGELAVGGYQLADGYLNRDEQTKAAFVRHLEHGMLYRTGDLARMRQDGVLECRGRISTGQVKLRGQRIELGEIEHAASKADGCRDVVAEVVAGVLVVFCVQDAQGLTRDSILKTCRKWLPAFMVPGDVVILDSLPYLASGKCDRKALRSRYEATQQSEDTGNNNDNGISRKITEVISSVLQVETKPDSILPGLGLDSLSSIRIASALHKAGLPQLDASSILTARTPRDIASQLERDGRLVTSGPGRVSDDSYRQKLDDTLTTVLLPASLSELETSFLCTPVQVAMLTETQKDPQAYCNSIEFLLPKSTNLESVETALRKLANQHPLLRSGFTPVTDLQAGYATMVWKTLSQDQVKHSSQFSYDFQIDSDEKLLRPCNFQLAVTGNGTRVLLHIHHALYDQWSIDLFRLDLARLLRGDASSHPASFKVVADYCSMHAEEAPSSEAVEFWQDHLREVAPTSMPLLRGDEVESALQRTSWQHLSMRSSTVKARAKELGYSGPALFQSVMAYFLSTYAGTPDIVLGSVFSGRNLPIQYIDSAFGPCLATLPFRVDFGTTRTFKDLLQLATDQNRALQQHILTPPTTVREAAGISPGTALFDSLFVWQESTHSTALADDLVRIVDSEDRLEFNLVLEFEPSPSNIKVRATYEQRLMSEDFIQVLLHQIDTLTARLLDSPDCLIQDLATRLSPELLSIQNPDPSEYAASYDLTTAIEARAEHEPSVPAVTFAKSMEAQSQDMISISYKQLDQRANQISHALIESGVKPQDIVCICMEKCIDLYVSMLAVFKAGAGYLPLAPETPVDRIKSVLAQANIKHCICDSESATVFEETTTASILDIAHLDLDTQPSGKPKVEQHGSRVAYAVFTSGSTGEPKGVPITMDNLKSNLAVLHELYQVQPGDRLLQSCSQAFDVSVFEIFFAFYSGMTLCSATKDVMFRDFEESIRSFRATHLSLTPTVAALVKPENVPDVRFLVTAGEGITERVHRTWAGHGLHQGYGPSETTNICSVKMNIAPNEVLGNIGPAFKNTSAFVLAAEGDFQILPAGAYGEFAFGGEQVFHGYIGRDELNAEKIINHPQFGRVYRSGDMGRILPDGTLLISGRVDDQVKIRGNRVELGEINAVVSDHSGVSDCTTIVAGERSADQALATFWVSSAEQSSPDSEICALASDRGLFSQLFDRLEGSLPTYMIPSILVPMNRLPMTAQGKLDKRLLRSILQNLDTNSKEKFSRSHEGLGEDPPTSETEKTMAAILSELLDVDVSSISRNSSFFALGLNSLNAIQFAKLAGRKLNASLGVTAILRHSSIARLGRYISTSDAKGDEARKPKVTTVFQNDFVEDVKMSFAKQGQTIVAVLPCTALQEAMLSASSTQYGAYCNTTKLHFDGDYQKLRDCWEEMIKRHAILRTAFVETPSATHPHAQVVLEDPETMWDAHSSQSKANGAPNGHANGHVNGNANGYSNGATNGSSNGNTDGPAEQHPDLPSVTHQSPVRVDILGTDIYLQMHHAVYDGVAVANLFEEMRRVYRGEKLPPTVAFEPFLEQVLLQNNQEAIDFWTARVSGFQPHPLPQQEQSSGQREDFLHRMLSVSPADIDAFCERHACTSLSLIQAAWVKTLACVQSISDVCFGNVVSGRSVPVPDVDRLVAPCFNTIPVRLDIEKARTNLGLLRNLHRYNVDTLPFQLTAPRRIQMLSSNPSMRLFDTLLLVQPPQDDLDLFEIEEEGMDMGIPIVLEIIPFDNSFELQMHYMPDRVPASLAPQLVDAFCSALGSCLRYPSSSVSHFLDFDTLAIEASLAPEQAEEPSNEADGIADLEGDWSDEQNAIRSAMAELAGVDPANITKQTSLYQIGLDSLNAVQLASRLRGQGFRVDAADVMQYQTPSELSKMLQSRQSERSQEPEAEFDLAAFDEKHRQGIINAVKVDEASVEAVRPCNSSQCGMLAQFIESKGSFYLNHRFYEIPQQHGISDIKQAWGAVQRKHQVLRMGFHQLEDAAFPYAMLIYKPDVHQDMVFPDVDGLDDDAVEDLVSEQVMQNLHLPAWRVSLLSSTEGQKMCLSLHHALYDADSLQVLLEDFAKALQVHDIGPATNLDSLLGSQLQGLTSQKSENEKFWKKALENARLVKFPNLTPTIVSDTRARSSVRSSTVSSSSIETYCKTDGVTIQALGQGVWAMLLGAYLGEPSVTFGTVFSGFVTDSSQPVAFPAISTVPVYCDTTKSASEVVKDMVSYNAGAQKHRFAALSDIQRYAGSVGQALFDTLFVYQKATDSSSDGFSWREVRGFLGVDYVASMEIETSDRGQLNLRLTYDIRSIPEEHAELLLKQYDMLLQSFVDKDSDFKHSDMSVMSHTPPKEPTIPCSVKLLHQFVERGAREHPDKPALEFISNLDSIEKGRKRWTYRELDERGNQIAYLLQQHGVKPGGVVALCMSKSAEASFAFVGTLKAGCAFLAMDPELPLARRKFIVEDSKSQLLFLDSGKPDAEMQEVVKTVELSESDIVHLPTSALEIPPPDPSMTSYCLYTSGTTGTPKGCELTHENAVQAIMSFQRLFSGHWTESSRWLQFASYWFDVSVLEQFWSWSVGVTLVGAPRDLVLEDLAGFIREANITHIDLTPSLARLLTPKDVPSLVNHVFITGGEALKQEIIDAWGPCKTICNGYGPTEATIGVTMNPFIGTDAKPSNIGPAFDNVGAYVFKPGTDELVMRGAVGELCVSGKLVGKGYLNRPDLTAKAFPYLDKYGERVYRTGDLVRLLADGSVSFIGRADTQAKLRGQRLEIDEIDAVIKTAAEGIFEVASLVSKSGDREMLISFVVDEESMSRDLQVVNSSHGQQLVQAADQACRSRLPGYMVPTHIVPVSRLPLTVNNKVDCKRLVSLFAEMTAQDLQKLKGSQTNDRQLRPTEQKIAKILSKLLSIDADDISPNSNVFSLGLSSVSAINFVTSLKHRGFKAANVARIMNNPILEHLSKAISDGDSETDLERNAVKQAQLSLSAFAQRYRSTAAKVLSIDLKKVEAVAPCTPLQEGLLIESMKTEHKPYFNHFWYDVFRLDLQRLETALHGLWNTIPMLRTSFFRTDDGYAQVVRGSADLPLEICDVQESKAEKFLTERREEWLHGAESDVSRPFEVVIARSKDKAIMAAHVHHASYDGISWELTMGLLTDLYEGKTNVASGPKFLDALPYGPLCHRPDAKSFWQQRLEDGSFMPLPIITEDEAVSDLSLHTSIDDVEALEATRKQLGVSHQALFQTAFAIALHQLSPETQSYGVVLSGRSISLDDADKVIGPLFNTVPFVVSLQSSSSWEQHLRQSQESNAAVLPFQHTPLREIRKYCGRPPGDPMFDVLFVFQRSDASSGQTLFESIDVELPAEYPIAFEVELEDSGHVSVNVAAQRKFVSEGSMQTLLNDFKTALDCIVKDHSKPISDNFKVRRNGPSTSAQDRMKQAPDMNGVSDFTWTDNAKVLQGVIAQVAGCDAADVDEHSTIFNLGLDSIDAVKMASRLKKEGLSIPVSTILQNQTIPRMLDTVQTGQQNEYDATVPSKLNNLEKQLQGLQKALDTDSQSEVERILPAAPGQEGLIADMMRSGFREYYNSDILRLREDVDIEKLKSAWQSVVDAAPILRTSFLQVADPDIDATFAQVVHRPAPLQFDDVSAHSLEDLDAHVDKVRMDVQATSESKSPLRLALATVASDKYLMLSLAHAQYDGHSLALVHQDVAKAYRLGTLDPRPPYDKAIELALSSTSGEALDFWRNNLSGGKASYIQAQEADVSSVTHRAKHTSKSSADRARDACKRAGVSMQALAQATWALLLAHRTQQLEVIFGAVLACRDSEEAEEILFATMNTVPVRSTIHGSGLEMLRYAQEAINEMRPYQRTPLRAIQNACSSSISTRGSASHGSLFDTLFIFQNRGEQDQDTEAPLYESVGGDSNVEYPVAVEIEAVDNDLLIRAACKSSALDKQGTKRLLQDFDRILETLIQAPDDQTIAFNGDQATICGLPGFQVHDERFSDMTGANVPTEQESSDDDDESPLTGSIRSALAKVSKIPEADVLPSSTIESIGIDSISAIKVSAILRKESIKLSVSDLLKAQTPSRMADAIEAKTATPVKDENAAAKAIAASLGNIDVAEICRRAGVDESNLEAIAPATAGQVYMLSMWQRSKGLLFYPTFRYHLQTQREFTDLQSAWMQLVKRNPILRTVFASSDTKKTPVLQLVLKSVAKSFVVDDQDISSSSTTSPLVKMQVKKGTDGFDLSLRIHHALYDAVSLPKLMEQFESILERSTTPGTEVNFKDFLALRLQDDAQTSRKTFWTRYLAKVHPISLAKGTKAATKKVQIFKPAFATLGAQLEQRARKAQVTAQALLFAIYAKVYAIKAVNEEGDVVFGIYLANRSHLSGLDQLTAPTLNLLPLLVQSPKDCDLVRLAKQIDTDLRLIGSMENSAASLQEIYEWTGVKLDSFVNFLKLPSQEDGEYTSSGNLTVIDDEWDRQRITVQDVVEPDDFALPQGLKGFEPSEAYQHALDVEISMVGNDLNIGVFCLERIMNLERAEGMVSRIKKELESFAEQS